MSGPRQGPKSAYFVADLCPCRGRGIAAAAAEGNKRPREASESLVDRVGRKSVYSGVHLGGGGVEFDFVDFLEVKNV